MAKDRFRNMIGKMLSIEPSKPPTTEHLALRNELLEIMAEAKADHDTHWELASLEPIIFACRKSFAAEIAARSALKFLEE